MNYTLEDWINERRVALDWEMMRRAERYPAMTSTDPNAVTKPEPVRFFSVADLREDRDWVRDAFLVKAEVTWFTQPYLPEQP